MTRPLPPAPRPAGGHGRPRDLPSGGAVPPGPGPSPARASAPVTTLAAERAADPSAAVRTPGEQAASRAAGAARESVGLVGAGRAGSAVALALASVGHPVVAVVTRSEVARARAAGRFPAARIGSLERVADGLRAADLLLVAVPDDAIAPTVQRLAALGALRAGQALAHLSGRHGLRALTAGVEPGAARIAMHPIMTLPGDRDDPGVFAGVPFGVTADPGAAALARRLVTGIGGTLVEVADDRRELYHAAVVLGGNFLASLTLAAREALAAAGLPEPAVALGPLLRASLDNALAGGWPAATGPIRRADVGTVLAHRRALAEVDPALAEVYRALASFTTDELARANLLGEAAAGRLRTALENRPSPGPSSPGP
ncbi:Rossmann-like and DUF2520 domain-containing protein [Frankia sp. AgB32]|uniref:Rossmann-like and DUF2520 domain-containing protein n=1 Tax=Frankia sp. AgB32 TaxID=631119 RepID=UPI00200D5E06|nr:Rossmann-like and DUF2520 domain-containing protein [Frankia sp. AgB32]MCK9895880.1 DUF2520 domain-containing protein [Frankia sp. AgB32]